MISRLAPIVGSEQARRAELRHVDKVRRIVRQLREHTGSRPVSLKKKAVSHQVPKPHDDRRRDDKIDISDLDEILAIDPDARTCTAESGVTFARLVTATMKHGLVPIIVPELRTITVGGAVSGCSIESMSFQYGGFHDTCLEYEVITASGEVLRCTPDNEHRLVFQMIHGSFGTLGIVATLTFRLIPAKPFVHVVHRTFDRLDAYQAAIVGHYRACDIDFMDGFVHSPSHYVLCLGRFVDDAPYANRYDWTKIYFESTKQRAEDYLATADYFFRYDSGVTNVHPKSTLGRLFLGKLLCSDRLLRLAHRLPWLLPDEDPDVTVDLFLPFSKLDAFMNWYRRDIGHFPLWVVPYRRVRDYEWIAPDFYQNLDDELFIDLAIYGMKQRPGQNLYKVIEDELVKLNGIKTLISYNYYDEDVFWSIWNRPNYLAVKRITDPENRFRDLYTKTCLAARGLESAGAA